MHHNTLILLGIKWITTLFGWPLRTEPNCYNRIEILSVTQSIFSCCFKK